MSSRALTLLHYGHSPYNRAVIDKTFLGYHALQYSHGGAVRVWVEGREYCLRGRWFWLTYDGGHFRYMPDKKPGWWDHHYLAFKGELSALWDMQGLLCRFPQQAPAGENWSDRMQAIFRYAHGPDPLDQLRAMNLFEGILIDLARARRRTDESEPWLVNVMDALADAGGEADYETLAAAQNMSLSSLRQRFREKTGKSIHQYAIACRIAQARHLLQETSLPIKEVANELGYTDVYFFSRQFKQVTGVSPGMFRRARP